MGEKFIQDPFQSSLSWIDLTFIPFNPYDLSADNKMVAAGFVRRALDAFADGISKGLPHGVWPEWPEMEKAEAERQIFSLSYSEQDIYLLECFKRHIAIVEKAWTVYFVYSELALDSDQISMVMNSEDVSKEENNSEVYL